MNFIKQESGLICGHYSDRWEEGSGWRGRLAAWVVQQRYSLQQRLYKTHKDALQSYSLCRQWQPSYCWERTFSCVPNWILLMKPVWNRWRTFGVEEMLLPSASRSSLLILREHEPTPGTCPGPELNPTLPLGPSPPPPLHVILVHYSTSAPELLSRAATQINTAARKLKQCVECIPTHLKVVCTIKPCDKALKLWAGILRVAGIKSAF